MKVFKKICKVILAIILTIVLVGSLAAVIALNYKTVLASHKIKDVVNSAKTFDAGHRQRRQVRHSHGECVWTLFEWRHREHKCWKKYDDDDFSAQSVRKETRKHGMDCKEYICRRVGLDCRNDGDGRMGAD